MQKYLVLLMATAALTAVTLAAQQPAGTHAIVAKPAEAPASANVNTTNNQQPATAPASVQLGLANPFPIYPIRPGVFWAEGGGGASGIIVGDTGVIVVDVKMTLSDGRRLLDDIQKVTTKPVKQVIFTHCDADHAGGLVAFPAPFSIIATPGCKKEVENYVAARKPNTPTAASLPTRLMTDVKEDVTIDGVNLQLLNFGPGHTGGDLMIYLPAKKIVFAGDILTMTRVHPLIHAEEGGTSEGYIAMLKGLLALDADIYVPGHGPSLVERPAVQKMYDELVAEHNQVKDLIAQGKTLQEIEQITGDPTQEEAHPTGRVPYFPPLAEVIYNELTKNAATAKAADGKQ